MTITADTLRADARTLAIEYGYAERGGKLRAPSGKFEGEPYYAVYYHDCAMNGCSEDIDGSDVLEIDDTDRAAFDLYSDVTHIALHYSESGFVTLEGLTAAQIAEWRAAVDSREVEPTDE